jgi:hypothetical protein
MVERLTSAIGRQIAPGEGPIIRAAKATGLAPEKLAKAEAIGFDAEKIQQRLDHFETSQSPHLQVVAAEFRGAFNDLLERAGIVRPLKP